ncbi:hypothetical protein PoB_005155700 [Plakobranchus ocellatus]|uniref:Uncharacterized protein n=1 Tax=Plakobranchus ocellatus TaxID=259542 RepID=A0AAV4C189_9GAST|nr:hypothetical protein PoB_005155700 [Plakobranchus ocellatus]
MSNTDQSVSSESSGTASGSRNNDKDNKIRTGENGIKPPERNCTVRGINDQQTRAVLLKKQQLTLEKCIDICRSAENTKTQGNAPQEPNQRVDSVVSRPKWEPTTLRKPKSSNNSRTNIPSQAQRQARSTQTQPKANHCGYYGYSLNI